MPLRVEDIEDTQWTGPNHKELDGPWVPFPNIYPEWAPLEGDLNPLDAISAQRKGRNGDRIEGPLSAECADSLGIAWNGDPIHSGGCAHHPGYHFHCYQITHHRQWDDWRVNPNYVQAATPYWYCTNIQNAAKHWTWTSFTGGTFEQLAAALQSAMRLGDQARTAAVCFQLLHWGGVFNRLPVVRRWILLRAHAGSLIADLLGATQLLSPYSMAPLAPFGPGGAYIIDAGTTKIYAAVALDLSNRAAVAQDVLIYDARIGAAIGLLCRYFLGRGYPDGAGLPPNRFPWGGETRVPQSFWFPWGYTTTRNPSRAPWRFPSFTDSGPKHRALMTRTASRCVQQVLRVNGPSPGFVAAEKGLFMIGYHVRKRCCGCAI